MNSSNFRCESKLQNLKISNRFDYYIDISLILLRIGENAALQYSVNLKDGKFGFMNITGDANYGKGKLNIDFTTMPGKYLYRHIYYKPYRYARVTNSPDIKSNEANYFQRVPSKSIEY